ncbi:MAG: UbiX family flavin prenyltransferase [Deltaproteobacteria bacterium]|nr:UbiX family flavin prenyltransferase [Deltaproteobacteria bacterium]
MKLVIAISGASGTIYAKQLLDFLRNTIHEVEVLASDNAKIVWADELESKLSDIPFKLFSNRDFKAHFASGSAKYDQMVIIPCSMGTLARIANGISDDLISRAADVFLKEKRKLIVVPRETPFNLIHIENMKKLALAGATIVPAIPSFYSKPQTVLDVVNTVVSRVLDQMGIENELMKRYEGKTSASSKD